MRKVVLVIVLILFANIALAANQSDFVKIETGDLNYFTHKNLIDSNYVVGSDKIFYGSKNGNVKLKIFLSEKEAIGTRNFRVGIRSHGSLIKITEVSVDGISTIIQNPKFEQDFTFQPFINLGKDIEEIEIELEFDPLDVGIREEIDIVLYDQFGNIVAVYDPFISGFNFRQQWIMNTNGIGLGGDVTINETILIHIPATNTDFWANHSFTDSNGMDFTQSDETTLLNWDVEGFDATNDDANIWVNFTPTFSSTFDSNGWMYYDGLNTDNSDGTAAYSSDLNAVYHSNDPSGGVSDSTVNAVNMTEVNTPTYGVDGQIDAAIDYDSGDFQKTSNKFTGTSGSISGWFNFDVNTTNQAIFGAGDEAGSDFIGFELSSDGFIEFLTTVSAQSDSVHGETPIAPNEWHQVVVTSNGSTWVLYLDGVAETLVVEEGSNTGEWFDDVSTIDNSSIAAIERSGVISQSNGTIDEVRVYTSTLTADEVKLLFNSESDTLITFGAEETSAIPPDINVTIPSDLGIEIMAGSIFLITFDVSDGDNNSLLVDLNFSSSVSQGTGTVIINDINTDSAQITCDDSDFTNSTNCTFSWTVPLLDGNFFILSSASDDEATAFDASDNNFSIFLSPPDANVTSPSATGIEIKGGDTFSITFDVQSPDNNSLLVDLNFSSSVSQGTGTVIINDINTDSAQITCDDSDFTNSTNCTFSWTTPTLDGEFFMLLAVDDGLSAETFDAGDNNFIIDSTVPVIVSVFPDFNFTVTSAVLDFNATITDSGSGTASCITRVFFDDILQPILDANVDGTSGLCERSLSSEVPNDTNVSMGFSAVDDVGNISAETVTQKIFLQIPPKTVDGLCIAINDDLAAAGGCIDDNDLEDTITSSAGLFVLEAGDEASLLMLFLVLGILIIIVGGIIFLPKEMKPEFLKFGK